MVAACINEAFPMSVSALETSHGRLPLAAAPAARGLGVEVASTFALAHPAWEALARTGCVTPYQQFGWVESYFRHVEAPEGAEPALVILRNAAAEPVMLLPLAVTPTRFGRVARFIGGKHANFHMPLLGADAGRLTAADIASALRQTARIAGIDLYHFMHQPLDWEGIKNPMALLGGQASPSAGYKTALEADGEAMLHARLSKDRRRKMRQKEAKLAAMGAVRYHKPASDDEARALLDRFLAQKAERFSTQGIDDPFAGPQVRAFLDEITTRRDAGGQPILRFHALMLDERPVAIFGGVDDGKRFSGVITAFDGDEEIARTTPGETLLMMMVKDCCARGLATFDLGVGEARYKMAICDATEPLIDTLVPVTVKGRLLAAGMGAGTLGKRIVKQTAVGRAALGFFRKMKARG